jgi:hypothetical protein
LKKKNEGDRLFDFIHTLIFTAMAALSEHAFYTIIERENKKIFPIFNQTISYK